MVTSGLKKTFMNITKVLGAEKWVIISTLTPLLSKILNIYLKFLHATDDKIVVTMKDEMYHDLSSCYHGTQHSYIVQNCISKVRRKNDS